MCAFLCLKCVCVWIQTWQDIAGQGREWQDMQWFIFFSIFNFYLIFQFLLTFLFFIVFLQSLISSYFRSFLQCFDFLRFFDFWRFFIGLIFYSMFLPFFDFSSIFCNFSIVRVFFLLSRYIFVTCRLLNRIIHSIWQFKSTGFYEQTGTWSLDRPFLEGVIVLVGMLCCKMVNASFQLHSISILGLRIHLGIVASYPFNSFLRYH